MRFCARRRSTGSLILAQFSPTTPTALGHDEIRFQLRTLPGEPVGGEHRRDHGRHRLSTLTGHADGQQKARKEIKRGGSLRRRTTVSAMIPFSPTRPSMVADRVFKIDAWLPLLAAKTREARAPSGVLQDTSRKTNKNDSSRIGPSE
ncbi:hypothetical protein ASPZODRAFT_1312788 [Penicilliopsis zonata CBS 506.65]|uniref:Uncharacterized protein n=1 Tax=Penicilliopsis zonata CBS 506.65 TaxID=1073090 RepID=A0A1L9S5Q4_9EURO|nr:hypothetical protein ASPZODRAFT_1312788 [Penicilliopsis zonata CBS 506.65]OJJ42484.1 hypothetical protein ASPZODRAFT_1312788 [Penicilliopsis zonata CBS 506.65]